MQPAAPTPRDHRDHRGHRGHRLQAVAGSRRRTTSDLPFPSAARDNGSEAPGSEEDGAPMATMRDSVNTAEAGADTDTGTEAGAPPVVPVGPLPGGGIAGVGGVGGGMGTHRPLAVPDLDSAADD